MTHQKEEINLWYKLRIGVSVTIEIATRYCIRKIASYIKIDPAQKVKLD